MVRVREDAKKTGLVKEEADSPNSEGKLGKNPEPAGAARREVPQYFTEQPYARVALGSTGSPALAATSALST